MGDSTNADLRSHRKLKTMFVGCLHLDNAASASEALLGVDAGEADADAALGLAVDLGVAADGVGARAVEAGGDGRREEGDDGEDGAHVGGFVVLVLSWRWRSARCGYKEDAIFEFAGIRSGAVLNHLVSEQMVKWPGT
ncbi:hypothetical protein Landi51_05291 [Colletotrichum acutatum]